MINFDGLKVSTMKLKVMRLVLRTTMMDPVPSVPALTLAWPEPQLEPR